MASTALADRIASEAKNLGNGILKADGFINHRLDAHLMHTCGADFAKRFEAVGATKILTAEVSGIPPAIMAGLHMRLPVVYARKRQPITMAEPIFRASAPSHTKGGIVELIVSSEYLKPDDRILIIDDFLARGETILALTQIVKDAGAELVGIGVLVEKSFEGGRSLLASIQVPIESLACIDSMDDGQIVLASS